jgi:hypothetical protein
MKDMPMPELIPIADEGDDHITALGGGCVRYFVDESLT